MDYTHGQMRSEIEQLETDLGLYEPPKTVRQELRDVVNAPKGSEVARARRTLGWTLILFGIFGVAAILFGTVLIGAIFGAIF